MLHLGLLRLIFTAVHVNQFRRYRTFLRSDNLLWCVHHFLSLLDFFLVGFKVWRLLFFSENSQATEKKHYGGFHTYEQVNVITCLIRLTLNGNKATNGRSELYTNSVWFNRYLFEKFQCFEPCGNRKRIIYSTFTWQFPEGDKPTEFRFIKLTIPLIAGRSKEIWFFVNVMDTRVEIMSTKWLKFSNTEFDFSTLNLWLTEYLSIPLNFF